MKRDFNYEILKFLHDSEGTENVNIRPLINFLIAETQHSGAYFSNMLSKLKKDDKIWVGDLISLSWVTNSPYEPDHQILARIEPDGIEDYTRLKLLYEGDPVANTANKLNKNQIITAIIIGALAIATAILLFVLSKH